MKKKKKRSRSLSSTDIIAHVTALAHYSYGMVKGTAAKEQ